MQDPSSFFGSKFGRIGISISDGNNVRTAGIFAPPPAAPQGSGLSKGDIAGILLGSVAVVAVLAGILVALLWHCKHRR